jgi:NitT/TauT family transport system permease protein
MKTPENQPPPLPGGTGPADPWPSRLFRNLLTLRREVSLLGTILLGLSCILLCLLLWWYVTRDVEIRTTITPAITGPARLTVAVADASGIEERSVLTVNAGLEDEEVIEVEAISGSDITVMFEQSHAAGASLTGTHDRILPHRIVPSPAETFASFPSLWFERELTRNTIVTLRRVVLGFGLAVLIGLPLGILCGCFPAFNAFLLPINVFGRNIPIAALIPLMYAFFGIQEQQKVMFIFFASVAFIISDTGRAIADVGSHYIDTAYTLGASRWQVILKVLVPLAMPSVFNSFRLLFGLAFGYIMLAETIKLADEAGGLGDIIITSQRRGPREHIILVLLIIPLVALGVDRLLFWIQRELFPHRYGGTGILNAGARVLLHGWEDFKGLFRRPAAVPEMPGITGAKPGGDKP